MTSDNAGVVVTALARSADVAFYPTNALRLADFVELPRSTAVSVAPASSSDVVITYRLQLQDTLHVEPNVIRDTIPCTNLTLQAPPRSPIQVDTRAATAPMALLSTAHRLKLSAEPGGPAVARLSLAAPLCVQVLDQRPGLAKKIAIDSGSQTLIGWIAEKALHPAPSACSGQIGTLGHGSGRSAGQRFLAATLRCSVDIPLGVEQAGKRQLIGFLRANTQVMPLAQREHDVTLDLDDAGLEPNAGATFWIARENAERCVSRDPAKTLQHEHQAAPWP